MEWLLLIVPIGQILGSLMTLGFFIYLIRWLRRVEKKIDNWREDW